MSRSALIRYSVTSIVFLFSITIPASAQIRQTLMTPRGLFDSTVPVPPTSVELNRKDGAALQEIVDHIKAVGFVNWKSASARGQMTRYSSDQDQTYATEMFIIRSDSIRLDVHTDQGVETVKYARRLGQLIASDGKKFPISPTAAQNGLTLFLSIRTLARLQAATTSIIDGGLVAIESRPMHRITIAFPISSPEQNQRFRNGQAAIDCYFDPQSHLLLKTAEWISENNSDSKSLLETTSYSDYRDVGGMMIPFAFQQTINGQKLWSLQLSDVRRDSGVDQSYFQF